MNTIRMRLSSASALRETTRTSAASMSSKVSPRFKTGKYGGNHAVGFMAGYLLSDDARAAAGGINGYLTRKGRQIEHLGPSNIRDAPWSRSSRHPRPQPAEPIDLHHAFLAMQAVARVTTDALLTQRALATYLLGRGAHYLFTVKGNQPNTLDDIRLTLDEHIAQRPTGLHRREPQARVRAPRAPLHLGLQRTQRLPRLPRCRTGLRHMAAKPSRSSPPSATARPPTASPA